MVRLPTVFRSTAALAVGIALIATLYVLGTTARARQKLLWHDEIVALTLARLPLPDLWAGLLDGTDLNPPLYHLTIHALRGLSGEGAATLRVPSMVGVAAAAIFVGLFVRRRLGPLAGLAAGLILLGTAAYRFAYEARPYGMELGFAAAALVCWQSAASAAHPRRWSVVGLLLCLAGAISCHYYAVFFLFALILAEIVRTLDSRRPDWPLWSVLVGSLFPLVFFWPLIATARSFSRVYFAPPRLEPLLSTYEGAFVDLIVPFVFALGLCGAAIAVSPGRPDEAAPRGVPPPTHEWALAIALTAVPLIGYFAAVLVTGAFVDRYFLTFTLGFSILVSFVMATVDTERRRILGPVVIVLLAFLAARDARSVRLLPHPSPGLEVVYPSFVRNPEPSLPIVVTHGHAYLVMVHYAPPALVSRSVYLFRPELLPTDNETRFLQGLARWNPGIHLMELEDFLRRHRRFLVYGPTPNPILAAVGRRGGSANLRSVDLDESLFAISRPGACSLFEVNMDAQPAPLALSK